MCSFRASWTVTSDLRPSTVAHAAVERDPRVGVLLPCNVVLYEKEDGRAVVGAVLAVVAR